MTIDLRNHAAKPAPQRPVDAVREAEGAREIPRARHMRNRSRERAVMIGIGAIVALIVVILLGYGVMHAWGYFFGGTEYEVRSLVEDVGEHMLLPKDETPTLATVSDLHALEGQEFFRNAKEGDKVLMYLISRQAILYRPSIDRIIEVGPITGSAQ